ncbi:MAG: hypothetical protein ACFE7R_10040, partial [Candidatus Hodarchaeota archaeon]
SVNNGPWELERGCWDRYHYSIECKTRSELIQQRIKFMSPDVRLSKYENGEGGRVRLQMDNPWHSVRPGGYVSRELMYLSIIGLIISSALAVMFIVMGSIDELFGNGGYFVLCCTVTVLALRTIVRWPSKLMPESELEELKLPISYPQLKETSHDTLNHLNEKRLELLWNLTKDPYAEKGLIQRIARRVKLFFRGGKKIPPDIRPRFVIITKMQDPFNFYNYDKDEFYDTFRDDIEYLYRYITDRCPMDPTIRELSGIAMVGLERRGRKVGPKEYAQIEQRIMERVRQQPVSITIKPEDEDEEPEEESFEDAEKRLPPKLLKFLEDAPEEVTQDYVQRAL